MIARAYLEQIYRLDQRIEFKLKEIDRLKELSRHVTSTLSDLPRDTSRGPSKVEEMVTRIVDLGREIDADVDRLVDLKNDAKHLLSQLEAQQRLLLELRYVERRRWEYIAEHLGYSLHHVYKLHNAALEALDSLMKVDTK